MADNIARALALKAMTSIKSAINDNGISKNTTWSSEKISNELSDFVRYIHISVNLIGSEGNIPLGNSIKLYTIVDDTESLVSTTLLPTGSGTVRVPQGVRYKITATTDVEGFYAPTVVYGVAISDTSATIRYTEVAYPKTIKDIQVLAQLGFADKVISIGDEFVSTYDNMENPWIVVEIADHEFKDGHTGQGVTLEMKYSTPFDIQFDAPHQELATEETAIEGLTYIGRTDNAYTLLNLSAGDTIPYSDYTYVYHDTIKDSSMNIYKYGHNNIKNSAVRQWLNSDSPAGEWYHKPAIGYCNPNQANTVSGFIAHLPTDFVDCVAETKRTYQTNTICDGGNTDTLYDKFFLPTVTEVNGSANANEGTAWTYYKVVTGLSNPSNDANTGRIKYALNAKTSPQICWLFSAYRGNSYGEWRRNSSGSIYNYLAHHSCRLVPACVIG